jgi:hypothetical protein
VSISEEVIGFFECIRWKREKEKDGKKASFKDKEGRGVRN